MDPTVPCLWGQMTAQLLGQILTKHEFKVYKVTNRLIYRRYIHHHVQCMSLNPSINIFDNFSGADAFE